MIDMPDRCAACGAETIREEVSDYTVTHEGRSEIIRDRHMACACGAISYRGAQIAEHELAVASAIRRMDGLLPSDELRRIRSKYRLKQTDMEQMLSTGPKTWTRWERGKIPQSKPTDKLIRALADDPSLAHRLMVNAGVSNPEAEAAFRQIEEDAKRLIKSRIRAELGAIAAGSEAERIVEHVFDAVADARRDAAAQTEDA